MIIHNVLDWAVKKLLILRNSTEDCIIPKIQKQEMKILHQEDMKANLEIAERRGVLPMSYLELLALQWENLNLEHRTISMSK